eukprot:CAMPEP_0119046456 /NCGR_PEP_ID=MMETSP1177-20130426/46711_1 /TAXON_ID=2985 /ORGANISM="Ochromonas sp, Strain CCMP1899" /LENGTH=388 /DNA_ID=CAMNT_0007019629 /DNA_START=277 /DNA_END=1440 /DNA_ORIENTATION=+
MIAVLSALIFQLILTFVLTERALTNVLLTPCIPLEGKTALVIGQDYDSINNYTSALGNVPFGLMSYTALRSDNGHLAGLSHPVDYGSGVEWAKGLTIRYNTTSLQLGLWLVGACEDVAEGRLDTEVKGLASFIDSISPTVVYLRIGYEFDSQENNYDVRSYREAFIHIVNTIRSMDVPNVAYVWHSSAQVPRDGYEVQDWYPGDDYVDWCGVSIFEQPYACQIADKCQIPYADQMAVFCKDRKKPLMIAESTPFGGIIADDEGTENGKENEAGYEGKTWSTWFVPVLSFISRHEVRIWSYINCNWDGQPMWAIKHARGVAWGDSRVEVHPSIRKRWQDEVLHSERFKWAFKQIGRDHYCQKDMNTNPAQIDYEDDDIYEDIKRDEPNW